MRFESRKTSLTILLLPFLLSLLSPVVISSAAQDEEPSAADPWEIWDEDGDYISCEVNGEGNAECEYVFPWGGDDVK